MHRAARVLLASRCARARRWNDAAPHPLAVRLLGRDLAIADVGGAVMAAVDRCPHRSTRLSVGYVEPRSIRCAYHGWRYSTDGGVRRDPGDARRPAARRAVPRDVRGRGRVRPRVGAPRRFGRARRSPRNPAWDDTSMRVLMGAPYTWPTSALRRVENFVDLAHFAWVHDGSLGPARRTGSADPARHARRRRAALPLRPAADAAGTRGAATATRATACRCRARSTSSSTSTRARAGDSG